MEDLGVGCRIILKCIIKKQDGGGVLAGFFWLEIPGGFLWIPLRSILLSRLTGSYSESDWGLRMTDVMTAKLLSRRRQRERERESRLSHFLTWLRRRKWNLILR